LSSLRLDTPLAWVAAGMPLSRQMPPAAREQAAVAPLAATRDPERERANAAMERYALGEDRAFSQLYDALAPRLHRYLLRASRDRGRADDLLQQTMLQIHRARGRYIVGAEVLPWAFAIARRLLIDSVRRSKHERRTISLETGERAAGSVDAAAEQRPADEVLDLRRLVRAIDAELACLPESQRMAFQLIQKEGLSVREAAGILGATPGAVRQRVHRAYAALRSALGDILDGK
jgi:RNA polymerase sigma-70 factor, ECF subfamily